jgi:cytochrome c6
MRSSSTFLFILLSSGQSFAWVQAPKGNEHKLRSIGSMDPKETDFQTQPRTVVSFTVGSAAVVLSLSFLLLAPHSAWSADVAQGATLFQANCAGCHAGGQNFMQEKKTLQKEALEKYLGTTDPVELQTFVQNRLPHKLLPFAMDDKAHLDVASYVSDQALSGKW